MELNARFDEALKSSYQHIATVLQNLCLSSSIYNLEESTENFASWEVIFDSFVSILNLDWLCDHIFKTVTFGVSFASWLVILILFCRMTKFMVLLLCRRSW